MLFNLSIENIALIEKADINFENGFNVLTGETGAGKSILIGSLNMLLGERLSHDIIRNGESYAYVEGLFYIDENTASYLEDYDVFADEDNAIILSRKLTSDGKNICKAGGKTVSVSTLRDIGRALINIHGQHDNQALLDKSFHLSFLDAYIPKDKKESINEYSVLYDELKETEKKLAELNIDETEKLRKIDILSYEIDEIKSANITPGEEEELKEKKIIAKNREALLKNCSMALDAIYENDEGVCAYNLFSKAKRFVDSLDFDELSEKMSDVLYEIEDVTAKIREKLDKINYLDFSIEEIEERIDVIYKLKRKYGVSEEDILEYCVKAEAELDSIKSFDFQKEELDKKVKILLDKVNLIAEKNSTLRKKYAKEIEEKINNELTQLNMENAEIFVEIEKTELNKNGCDKVEFLLSANKGEPPKPLTKIVSGGELSRIMLALKNVLSAGDIAGTLIFDEIDTGISGRAAGKVGQKLYDISKKKQVLCVTHLPQIASTSDHHFKISKIQSETKTNTVINKLNNDERIAEIALMIGGDSVTDITLKQAEDMIHK